jgi:hypothetical protein
LGTTYATWVKEISALRCSTQLIRRELQVMEADFLVHFEVGNSLQYQDLQKGDIFYIISFVFFDLPAKHTKDAKGFYVKSL